MLSRLFLLTAVALVLAGCATTTQGDRRIWPYDEPPVIGAPSPAGSGSGGGQQPQTTARIEKPQTPGPEQNQPRRVEDISGPAVMSLVRQARAAGDSGQLDQAAAALERALRIEPRNYFVWSLLARNALARGENARADSLARKSNALARGNVYAEIDNWRIIAAACKARGDASGAAEAERRTAELERSLQPSGFW